jgi:hypothetical protein
MAPLTQALSFLTLCQLVSPPPPYMKCHLHSGKQPVAFLMVLPAIGGSGKWFGPFGGQSQSSPSRVVAVR